MVGRSPGETREVMVRWWSAGRSRERRKVNCERDRRGVEWHEGEVTEGVVCNLVGFDVAFRCFLLCYSGGWMGCWLTVWLGILNNNSNDNNNNPNKLPYGKEGKKICTLSFLLDKV